VDVTVPVSVVCTTDAPTAIVAVEPSPGVCVTEIPVPADRSTI